MITENFVFGDVLGKVRRFLPRGGDMDQALILTALGTIYPELQHIDTESLTDMLAITRIGLAVPFATLYTQLVELHNVPFEVVQARWASPEQLDVAYQHYLYDDSGLWDALQEAADRLNNPNGTVAGVLSPAEQADPLSEASAEPTSLT